MGEFYIRDDGGAMVRFDYFTVEDVKMDLIDLCPKCTEEFQEWNKNETIKHDDQS